MRVPGGQQARGERAGEGPGDAPPPARGVAHGEGEGRAGGGPPHRGGGVGGARPAPAPPRRAAPRRRRWSPRAAARRRARAASALRGGRCHPSGPRGLSRSCPLLGRFPRFLECSVRVNPDRDPTVTRRCGVGDPGGVSVTGIPHSSHWGAFRADPTEEGRARPAAPRRPGPLAAAGQRRGRGDPARPRAAPARAARLVGGRPGPRRAARARRVPAPWGGTSCWTGSRGSTGGCWTSTARGRCSPGSYGWASAGRFHHAQSQLHRFSTAWAGPSRSSWTYSHSSGRCCCPASSAARSR